MKVFLLSLIFTALTFSFSGCMGSSPQATNGKPSWILNPMKNGKVGAVGIADTHVRGLHYQKDLAVKRALTELSEQQGVDVQASSKVKEYASSDGRSGSSINNQATFNTNSKVTAHIEAVWQDPMSDKLYVWMVMD